MLRRRHLIFLIGITAALGLNALAGSISGVVTDEAGLGLPGIGVRVVDEVGEEYLTETDKNGEFTLSRLLAGTFYTELVGDNNQIIKPECGFYREYLDINANVYYSFEIFRPTGVSVDFGSPIGTKRQRRQKAFLEIASPFERSQPVTLNQELDLIFSVKNLNFLTVQPNRILIRGAWYSRGEGPLDIQVVEGKEEYFAGMKFLTTNNWDHRNLMVIDLCGGFFNQDGDIARFTFSLGQSAESLIDGNDGELCFCVEEVTFYQDNSPLIGMNYLWCGQLSSSATSSR